jgi:long-chain acyl-CoA synthetase
MYSDKFWKKNWDKGMKDLEPQEFETTYVKLIEKSFEKFPNKAALTYLGIEVTFGELDKYANQFANMLVENGFDKGDIVGIHLPNTPQYLIAMIGTLRAGCIVSGISPLLPPEQVKYQLDDLTATGKKAVLVTLDALFPKHVLSIASDLPLLKLVVTTSIASFLPKFKQIVGRLLKKIPTGKVTPIPGKTVLDFSKDILHRYSAAPLNTVVTPDDLGWIQYTGGTTGAPKGAMLSHRNACHNILAVTRWFGWENEKAGIVLSGFPMFHIAGLMLCEVPISLGWTQVLIPNPRDTDRICEEMARYHPTALVNVPSLYQLLMENPKFKKLDFSKVTVCISGAAPFPKESQEELAKIIGSGKLLELLGMTETSPVNAMNPAKGKRKIGSVGLPLLNTDFKIIDTATGKETEIGVAGELYIKGPSVMQGYFNKPEETKSAVDEDGYMHTGDVGFMDEEGYITIVDRTKDMIIVGGFKVFSNKVEDMLSSHPAVDIIVLIGVPNPERPGSEIVKAYIKLDPGYKDREDGGEEALKADFIKFAKMHCTPYEVPKIIEIIDEIPLTAVGKIDKKALRNKG